MDPPILFDDQVIAASKKNKDECHFYLPAENLDENLPEARVHVERKSYVGLPVPVSVKKISIAKGKKRPRVLIVKTEKVPKQRNRGETEEITVTITGTEAKAIIEVVYYNEETDDQQTKPTAKKQTPKKTSDRR